MSEGEPKQAPFMKLDRVCSELDVREDTEQRANEFVSRATYQYPMNRSHRVLAAGAIYLAGLIEGDKHTQKEVAEAADVNKASIRDCYVELADHEDISLRGHDTGGDNQQKLVVEEVADLVRYGPRDTPSLAVSVIGMLLWWKTWVLTGTVGVTMMGGLLLTAEYAGTPETGYIIGIVALVLMDKLVDRIEPLGGGDRR